MSHSEADEVSAQLQLLSVAPSYAQVLEELQRLKHFEAKYEALEEELRKETKMKTSYKDKYNESKHVIKEQKADMKEQDTDIANLDNERRELWADNKDFERQIAVLESDNEKLRSQLAQQNGTVELEGAKSHDLDSEKVGDLDIEMDTTDGTDHEVQEPQDESMAICSTWATLGRCRAGVAGRHCQRGYHPPCAQLAIRQITDSSGVERS